MVALNPKFDVWYVYHKSQPAQQRCYIHLQAISNSNKVNGCANEEPKPYW